MSEIAIQVEHLSKQFRIGANSFQKTFRETVSDAMLAPARRLRSALRGQGTQTATKEFWALRDVSFDVNQGEVVGIIGHNGAGKSTLLKVLSRITEPTSGSAMIRGRVGTLLEVGTGFHPDLTGRENMYLNGAILGMSRAEINRKFDEIVAFAEVEQFIDTMVKHYSSGMYLRLAFAVAAHLEPEILIVDEVLAVGDAQFQKKCLGKMGEVAQNGRTVLFVSHNMAAIRSLCQRVIWLNKGTVLKDGPSASIVNEYLMETVTSSSSRVDLREAVRHYDYGKRFKINDLTFNHGEPILHGEALNVSFNYEAYADVYGVSFGYGFSSLEGTRLMTVDSDLNAPRYQIKRGQHGQLTSTIDTLNLQPGIYLLDVGVRSGDGSALDYLPGCAQVEILPGPSTPPSMSRLDYAGNVRLSGHWQWPETAQEDRD
ncbi:ABC transporter ATP-binding protein [Herpetosiphon llansteffanensis]|uniref:ABC transporter ATP-binding protein n=1 Tax=Herpetosiphon llansteffanensis TaxID=2094568 RepID=UPI000D7C3D8C|nr:ABC transporter ATP-binding protein [Herpetosiphon llansteffanensis]